MKLVNLLTADVGPPEDTDDRYYNGGFRDRRNFDLVHEEELINGPDFIDDCTEKICYETEERICRET